MSQIAISLTSNFFPFNTLFPQFSKFFQNNWLIELKWAAVNNLYSVSATNVPSNIFHNLSIYTYVLNLTVLIAIGSFACFVFLNYGAKFIATLSKSFDVNYTIFTYFTEFEEEMGASDDGVTYYLLFALIIVWFFGFFLFSAYLTKHLSWILTLTAISTLTAFIVPSTILKNYGLAFVAYVRGHGRTTSTIYESLLDIVSVSIIIIRFLIQNLRFVFIFFAFFEIYEYIYQALTFFSYLPQITDLNTNYNFSAKVYSMELLVTIVINWLLYLYYLGHLTILFIAQLAVYFALSFWLFFFLYTSFTLETQEKYFFFAKTQTVK